MPKLGESVHEGTIEQWLVSVGDHVDEYDPLCEVITDKVTAEVPSTVSGTITELTVSEGETVEIDTVICKIDSPEENSSEINSNDDKQNASNAQKQNVKEETSKKINILLNFKMRLSLKIMVVFTCSI